MYILTFTASLRKHSWSFWISHSIWNVLFWVNHLKQSTLKHSHKLYLWSHSQWDEAFVVQSRPLDRLEHPIYILVWPLAPLNSDGGRKSHIFQWNKSFIIELWLLKPCCPSMEHWFLDIYVGYMWEWLGVGKSIKDVRIIGFYRSAETARQNLVCSSVIAAAWRILTVQVRVNLGNVMHFAWHCESFENYMNNLLGEKHQQAKPNPNVSFGREACSAVEMLYLVHVRRSNERRLWQFPLHLAGIVMKLQGMNYTYGTRSSSSQPGYHLWRSSVHFDLIFIDICISPVTEVHVRWCTWMETVFINDRIKRGITLALIQTYDALS